MARPRTRACLQDGLKLDLNWLARRGFIKFGANIGTGGIQWNHSAWDGPTSGTISADMSNPHGGWLRIELGSLVQHIELFSQPRHFGGRQWFFVCPASSRLATVLWKPQGATRFCSRQSWRGQVAYHSQFLGPTDRIWRAKSKLNNRLCDAGGFAPDEWEFPPKPKWMRWSTYERYEQCFDELEAKLDADLHCAALRLSRHWEK